MNLRRRITRLLAPPLVAAILAVHVDGCASQNARTHGLTEPNTADESASRHLALARVSSDTEVELKLRDSSTVRGRFRGIARMNDEDYAAHVREVVASRGGGPVLPMPGTTIAVQTRKGKPRSVRLHGYGFRSLEVSERGRRPQLLPFEDVVAVQGAEGGLWSGDALTAEAVDGLIPAFAVIQVRSEAGDLDVPVDRVAQVSHRTRGGNWVVGGIVVAVFAGVLVLAFMAASAPPSLNFSGCSGTSLY